MIIIKKLLCLFFGHKIIEANTQLIVAPNGHILEYGWCIRCNQYGEFNDN